MSASERQLIFVRTSGTSPAGESAESAGATAIQSVLNLCKVCIGTGALALPFAFKDGGLLFGAIGLLFVAAWNMYASQRIDALRQYTGQV